MNSIFWAKISMKMLAVINVILSVFVFMLAYFYIGLSGGSVLVSTDGIVFISLFVVPAILGMANAFLLFKLRRIGWFVSVTLSPVFLWILSPVASETGFATAFIGWVFTGIVIVLTVMAAKLFFTSQDIHRWVSLMFPEEQGQVQEENKEDVLRGKESHLV